MSDDNVLREFTEEVAACKDECARLGLELATPVGLIYGAMVEVMGKIEAVAKDRKNEGQGFKFRGIDEVYNMIHKALTDAKIFTVPKVVSREEKIYDRPNKSPMIRVVQGLTFRFTTVDGSFVEVGPIYGESMDSGDKATNKTNSAAHKYALLMAFCIPTKESEDADADSPELPPSSKSKPAGPKPAPKESPVKPKDDSTVAKEENEKVPLITRHQYDLLQSVMMDRAWGEQMVRDVMKKTVGKVAFKELNATEWKFIMGYIQQNDPPKEGAK